MMGRSGQFRSQKGPGPLEIPHCVFCHGKKGNLPDFQNQRYINSITLVYDLIQNTDEHGGPLLNHMFQTKGHYGGYPGL
jgi:hypothetical protein